MWIWVVTRLALNMAYGLEKPAYGLEIVFGYFSLITFFSKGNFSKHELIKGELLRRQNELLFFPCREKFTKNGY